MSPARPSVTRPFTLLLGPLALLAVACGSGSGTAEVSAPAPLGDADRDTDELTAPAAPGVPDDGGAASGAGVAAAGTVDPQAAQAAADVNIDLLQPSNDVRLVEVLNVADGSIATLDEAVWGDRPVLLWFWAPH